MLKYVWVFIALVLLTALTFGLTYVPLGPWGVPSALLIAAAKTALIALFFMHLVEQRTTNWVSFVIALLMVAILIALAVLDVGTRFLVLPVE
jgi:cytochrome c oxidase subunit 4